ncbi:NAD(P)H-dependent oxidoreductase [Anaerotignum faecicola]|nr:NAD(P)H-dependent oxidoreductase [Anaerotignum faecicola]
MQYACRRKSGADGVVCFATPVYTSSMTAAIKNFIDRLAPLKIPQIIRDKGSFDLIDIKNRKQKFVVISNHRFPGENNFRIMKTMFSPCSHVLEIYRNGGML